MYLSIFKSKIIVSAFYHPPIFFYNKCRQSVVDKKSDPRPALLNFISILSSVPSVIVFIVANAGNYLRHVYEFQFDFYTDRLFIRPFSLYLVIFTID